MPSLAGLSSPSAAIVIGTVIWSAHFFTIVSSRIGARNSPASAFTCSTIVVPAASRTAGLSVNAPAPSDAHSHASSLPARRLVTSTRSATMNAA